MRFQTVEELESAIDAWAEERRALDKPFTMTSLARFLGTNRQVILNYRKEEDRKEYWDAVKRARVLCEEDLEERLLTSGKPIGCIFSLKNNFGWEDKRELTITNTTDVEKLMLEGRRRAENTIIDITPTKKDYSSESEE